MDPSEEPEVLAAALEALPNWFVFGVPLIGLGLLLVLSIGVLGLWTLLNHVRRIEQLSQRLDLLENLLVSLKSLAAEGKQLDVRRIEHVLLEIRDGQKRLDETLISTREAARSQGFEGLPMQQSGGGLSDRVVNRLVALGYERIQLLTPLAEIESLERAAPREAGSGAEQRSAEGEIFVEARRHGAICKGRIQVRDGQLSEVQLQPTYGAFP